MKRKKLFLTAIVFMFLVFLFIPSKAKAGAYDEYLTYSDYKYEYDLEDNSIRLMEYTGKAKKVWIPATIDGAPVRYLGNAFYENKKIQEVHLPNTLVYVSGFDGCTNLREVNIPKSVKIIGDYAFTDCKKLKKIELPEGLRKIGCLAFANCDSLKEVRIPDSVIKIESAAFCECNKLEKVVLSKRLKCIEDETFVNCKKLKSIVIPEGVKEIRKEAFCECKSLKKVKLSVSLVVIGDMAFDKCDIKEITIPKNVMKIGEYAFAWSENLKKVIIKGTKIREIAGTAFCGCKSKTVFDVPNKSIRKYRKMFEKSYFFKAESMKMK